MRLLLPVQGPASSKVSFFVNCKGAAFVVLVALQKDPRISNLMSIAPNRAEL